MPSRRRTARYAVLVAGVLLQVRGGDICGLARDERASLVGDGVSWLQVSQRRLDTAEKLIASSAVGQDLHEENKVEEYQGGGSLSGEAASGLLHLARPAQSFATGPTRWGVSDAALSLCMVIITFVLLVPGRSVTDYLHRVITGQAGEDATGEKGEKGEKEADPGSRSAAMAKKVVHLRLNAWLTFVLLFVTACGGMLTNSLAVLAQVLYLFSDICEGVLSIWTLELWAKPATLQCSYGLHQIGALGTLLLVMLLWTMAAALFVQALDRVVHPEVIYGPVIVAVAAFGLAWRLLLTRAIGLPRADLASVLTLGAGAWEGQHQQQMAGSPTSPPATGAAQGPPPRHAFEDAPRNGLSPQPRTPLTASRRASPRQSRRFRDGLPVVHNTMWHAGRGTMNLLGEATELVVVLLVGGLVWWEPFSLGATKEGVARWCYLDPLVSLLCICLTLGMTRHALCTALMQLLMACPQHLNLAAFRQELCKVPGVASLHDLHVWQIGQSRLCSAHIVVEDEALCDNVLRRCTEVARQSYLISKATLQIEIQGDFDKGGERLRLNATTCHDTDS